MGDEQKLRYWTMLSTEESKPTAPQQPMPINIATISAGFDKGDFLVREEAGSRTYFYFFEEAFNYISNRGYCRMSQDDEKHWMDLVKVAHKSVDGGMEYNAGALLLVLARPAPLVKVTPSISPSRGKSEKGDSTKQQS